MVEIFKTNIEREGTATNLKLELLEQFPDCKINFDLEDCDRILRIESAVDIGREIEKAVTRRGFQCEQLF